MKQFAFVIVFLILLALTAVWMQPVYAACAGNELSPDYHFYTRMGREMLDVARLCGIILSIVGLMIVIAGPTAFFDALGSND